MFAAEALASSTLTREMAADACGLIDDLGKGHYFDTQRQSDADPAVQLAADRRACRAGLCGVIAPLPQSPADLLACFPAITCSMGSESLAPG